MLKCGQIYRRNKTVLEYKRCKQIKDLKQNKGRSQKDIITRTGKKWPEKTLVRNVIIYGSALKVPLDYDLVLILIAGNNGWATSNLLFEFFI